MRTPRLSMGGWFLVFILLLLALYLALLELSRPRVDGTRLRVDQFVTAAENGRVNDARILDADGIVVGTLRRRDGTAVPYTLPYFREEGRQAFIDLLLQERIPVTVDQQVAKAVFFPAVLILVPSLVVVLVFVYFILAARRGTGIFAVQSGARKVGAEDTKATFADVAGQDEAVAELREVSEFLSKPDRYAAVGAQLPKGILLFGPPGCGKTLLARALAGEAGASFYSISGSDFVELYVGVGASRVRDLFREARENVPAIVFIDELDSVGRRRESGETTGGSSAEHDQALNQILAELDGFSSLDGIVLIGATNRPDTLDPALLRPGRFDRSIGLELPGRKGRADILSVHARGKPLAPGVDLDAVAERAVGMTGADLASVVNEAGLRAARAGESAITEAHLAQGLERVMEAPERQRRLSMRDRSIGQRTLAQDRATFAAVAGADQAIEELREVKEYLTAPERFTEIGARVPRGYLLSGPPGTGKTLLARAVAGESNAAFISAAGTEFVERYAGGGAARVRDLFAEARAVAPAILFIDEIDAVGGTRGVFVSDAERHQTLNQILVELDGFSQRAGVVVMAATNRPDTLDPALVRPGRFDRHVVMDLPDIEARRAILGVHAAGKRLGPGADLAVVARLTRGMSGADLANVLNEAALLAARRRTGEITMPILEEAIERSFSGVGGARRMSDADRRAVAYHEAGHGLVAMALPGGRVLHRLSIIPRGRGLGAAWLPESDDRYTHSRTLLMERMATLLGGRTAEELVFGEPADAAGADLAEVARVARDMVSRLGMSDLVGAINYADDVGHDGRPMHSEETARLIDAEARRLVEEAGDMARQALLQARGALDLVAEALMERETLTLEEVEEIARSSAASLPVGGTSTF